MKVVIFTSGDSSNGVYSCASGEGRWAYNLAISLSKYASGIDIYLAQDSTEAPRQGCSPVLPRLHYINRAQALAQSWDVAVYIPWESRYKDKWIRCDQFSKILSSKLYIHNSFSWSQGILEFPCHEQGHILVYPFAESWTTFRGPDGNLDPSVTFKVEFLPYPFGWDQSSIDLTRKEIVWAAKDVFAEEFTHRDLHIPRGGIETLKAFKMLADKHPSLGSFNYLFAHTFETSTAKNLNAKSLLVNPVMHQKLTYDKLYSVYQRSILSVPVGGLSSGVTESVCTGALPLLYRGSLLEPIMKDSGLLLNAHTVTAQEIFEMMDLFLGDQKLYTELILKYQDFMKEHQQHEVARKFIDICQKHS